MSRIFQVVKTLEMFNICFPDFWMWTMDITYTYVWGALKNSFSPPEVNVKASCVRLLDPNILISVQG